MKFLFSLMYRALRFLSRFLPITILQSEDDVRNALGLSAFPNLLQSDDEGHRRLAAEHYPRQSGRTTAILVGALWTYILRGRKGQVAFCSPSKHRSERMLCQFRQYARKLKIPVERLESYGSGSRTRWGLEQEITRGRRDDVLVVWDHEDP